jgi:hypothetical protein
MIQARSVDLLVAPTAARARKYFAAEQPVLLRDSIAHWPARDLWTKDALRALPDREVFVASGPPGPPADPGDAYAYHRDPVPMTMRAFIDAAFADPPQDGRAWYLRQAPLSEHKDLAARIGAPPFVVEDVLARNLWIGSAGNVTPAHYDTEDNLHVVLSGEKRVVLLAPDHADDANPYPAFDRRANFARKSITHHPRRYEVTVRAGDALYIPIYWWHHVETVQAGAAVNFWWRRTAAQSWRVPGLRYVPKTFFEGYGPRYVASFLPRPIQVLVERSR